MTIDLLRKDYSAAISRFRRRGIPLCGNASRLYYDFGKIIQHIHRICLIIFSASRTKSDNFGDGAISPVRNTPRVLTTKIFTQ